MKLYAVPINYVKAFIRFTYLMNTIIKTNRQLIESVDVYFTEISELNSDLCLHYVSTDREFSNIMHNSLGEPGYLLNTPSDHKFSHSLFHTYIVFSVNPYTYGVAGKILNKIIKELNRMTLYVHEKDQTIVYVSTKIKGEPNKAKGIGFRNNYVYVRANDIELLEELTNTYQDWVLDSNFKRYFVFERLKEIDVLHNSIGESIQL